MSSVADVFISSVQTGFQDVRTAVHEAVEAYGHRAVMAETVGAAPASPQRGLLNRVADCDIFLLLVGPRYGERQQSGVSATEEEFDEARRSGKDILVLVQAVERDAEQEEFLRRVTYGWEEGILRDTFHTAADIGLALVRALRNLEARGSREALVPAAQARAQELATDDQRDVYGSGGALVRVVLVPLRARPLLDAVALSDGALGEDLAAAARSARLVPQSLGINPHISAAGVRLDVGEQYSCGIMLMVGAAGEVIAEASAAGSGSFGSMRIVPERVGAAIRSGLEFAELAWRRIDDRNEVQEAAVTVAVPRAHSLRWGPDRGGNAISMGGSMLDAAIAPMPPAIHRRADLARDDTIRRLVTELERVFVDAGAVDSN